MFLLAMGLADHLFFHQVEWDTLTSFVVRSALNESAPKSPDQKMYQRVLVLFWLLAVFILIRGYAGNISSHKLMQNVPYIHDH